MRNLLLRLAVLLCIPVLGFAADVSGKWKAEFTTPDGTPRVNTFVLKSSGDTVTGTVAGSQDETPIKNGRLSGDQISFTADRPFGTFTYKGTVSGAEMKLRVSFNDQSYDIVAKRVSD